MYAGLSFVTSPLYFKLLPSGIIPASLFTKSTSLCFEANVVSFGEGPGASAGVQSANTLWLSGTQQLGANSNATKDGGWMTMDLGPRSGSASSIAAPGRRLPGTVVSATNIVTGAVSLANPVGSVATFVGLPVIGFSVSGAKVTSGPQLNNYGSSVSLTPTRRIAARPPRNGAGRRLARRAVQTRARC